MNGFGLDHLPYGAFSVDGGPVHLGVRLGDSVLDLAACAPLRPEWASLLAAPTLNPLMASGPAVWAEVRAWVTSLLSGSDHPALVPLSDVTMHLAWEVADYVDYYASEHHATNVGKIFRPDGDALLPNWKHLPVAYHGRAGSIVVSGTDIHRPCGQRVSTGSTAGERPTPTYGPSQRLDIEAELGFVVGRTLPLGSRASVSSFEETVFGVTGVNDWSARDVQAWEYVPLGPNLAKSFATSVGAWVTPLAALEAARIPLPAQTPTVLPYLASPSPTTYDISVEVELNGEVVARPPYGSMYWSPAQMLAHLTVNGASLRVGDFYASGTISGPDRDQRGSFLELSWGGKEPFTVAGHVRAFLEDGDEVVLRYSAPSTSGGTLTLGEVRGTILPAVS